jgi:hypothetical protein
MKQEKIQTKSKNPAHTMTLQKNTRTISSLTALLSLIVLGGMFVTSTLQGTLLENLANFKNGLVKKAHAQTAVTATSSAKTVATATSSAKTAVTTTSSAKTQESEEDISVTTRNLRERIERIVEEKRDQIKGVLTEIDSKRRATIGEILRVTEDTLSIRSQTGTEIIPISNTRYPLAILKNGEPINYDEIAVGNWLLAFGVIEDDSFQPIRLLVSEDSLRPRTRSVSIGTITKIARTSIEIEPRSGESPVTYTISTNTEFQDLSGETISLKDIEEKMQAIVAGIITSTDEDEGTSTRTALKIRVLTTIETQ